MLVLARRNWPCFSTYCVMGQMMKGFFLRRWQEEGHVCRAGIYGVGGMHIRRLESSERFGRKFLIFIYRRDPDAYANFQAAHSNRISGNDPPYSYDSDPCRRSGPIQASSSLRRALRVRTGKQMGLLLFQGLCLPLSPGMAMPSMN